MRYQAKDINGWIYVEDRMTKEIVEEGFDDLEHAKQCAGQFEEIFS